MEKGLFNAEKGDACDADSTDEVSRPAHNSAVACFLELGGRAHDVDAAHGRGGAASRRRNWHAGERVRCGRPLEVSLAWCGAS